MPCSGSVTLECEYEGAKVKIDALVSSALKDYILLSWHDLVSLGILPQNFPARICQTIKQDDDMIIQTLVMEFSDVFDTKSIRPMAGKPMHIHLEPDSHIRPKRTLTARQVPIHFREEADRVIHTLLDSGIIAPVSEPTDWISPAFFVPKEGGKSGLRLCHRFV